MLFSPPTPVTENCYSFLSKTAVYTFSRNRQLMLTLASFCGWNSYCLNVLLPMCWIQWFFHTHKYNKMCLYLGHWWKPSQAEFSIWLKKMWNYTFTLYRSPQSELNEMLWIWHNVMSWVEMQLICRVNLHVTASNVWIHAVKSSHFCHLSCTEYLSFKVILNHLKKRHWNDNVTLCAYYTSLPDQRFLYFVPSKHFPNSDGEAVQI